MITGPGSPLESVESRRYSGEVGETGFEPATARPQTGHTGAELGARALAVEKAGADAAAPGLLVELTAEARRIVLLHDEWVHGNCVYACMALGRALLHRGLPATMRSVTASGFCHWCVRSGEWVLDPTAGLVGRRACDRLPERIGR